jgi:hypothetical protein
LSGQATGPQPAGLPDLSGLANLALFRPASQSSTSPWSNADDASGAVNGNRTGGFGFHTAHEAAAWWQVDLQRTGPVRYVILWNREDAGQGRARNLRIETSTDGETWEAVGETGEAAFGGALSMTPFVADCGDRPARFVRIRRTRPGFLHLDEVEVYGVARHREVEPDAFLRAIGEDPATLRATRERGAKLRFLGTGPTPEAVRSLSPLRFGRLGNQVKQILQAIHFARRHGIGRIHLDSANPGGLRQAMRIGGLEFHPEPADFTDGPDLQAHMFFRAAFPRSFADLDGPAMLRIAEDYIRPLMGRFAAAPPRTAPTLHIHLRSGDLFATARPHGLYVQPPLAFYQLAVRDAVARLGVRQVVMIHEDEGNPCVGALRGWLAGEGIACFSQSGTLEADIGEMLAAENLVIAFGTFALPTFLLSERLRHVHAFRMLPNTEFLRARGVAWRVVEDAAGGYIQPGSWRNTPQQRATMLDYPCANLRFVD